MSLLQKDDLRFFSISVLYHTEYSDTINHVRRLLIYKINVIDELNKHGYTNSILRDNNFLSQATLTNLRRGGNITIATLNILCLLLDCQPGDIIEISASEEEKKKYFL